VIISRRPRRNRKNAAIRDLVAETNISTNNLIYPVFICDGKNITIPIKSMPGQNRVSVDVLCESLLEWTRLGLKHLALFPQISENMKDSLGKESLNNNGLLPNCIKKIKDQFPELNLITDVALDPYSSDGHDGIYKNGQILNDESVDLLCKMAVKQAEWGSDSVAPSDMMDGRVGAIRNALEESGFTNTGLISYAAKYASNFYGPFREALDSAPKHGDKKTYQMDFRNSKEAILEAQLDEEQGADMVMVKPGLPYLDIITQIKQNVQIPVAAYNVSGEYAMIKLAAQAGVLNESAAILEILTAFRRAGADAIFTYFAIDAFKIMEK
jgi:porphobilinogen synthase